ncbi:MAG: hypothetical protein ABSG84_11780 [Acidobacteriaceae bacterium]|jgi:hypothetical protein
MKRAAAYIFTCIFVLAFIDASLAQLQVWLFDCVVVPEYFAKIGVFAAIVTHWMFGAKQQMDRRILFIWVLLGSILAVCFIAVRAAGSTLFADQVNSLFTNYLYLMCLPICLLCLKPLVRLSFVFRILAFLMVPLCALGIAQYLLSDPLVATSTSDGSFRVVSWAFEDRVRAFSLFASGFSFSCYLALMMGYCVAYVAGRGYSSRVRLLALAGCGVVALATYASITRLGFMFVFMAALFAACLSRWRKFNRISWFALPLVGFMVAGSTLLLAPLIASGANTDLVSDLSLVDRLLNWNIALNTWTGGGLVTFLFGTGISQGSANDTYAVDNTFLNFAVQVGAIGLVGSVVLMYAMWMSFRRSVGRRQSPAVIAVCAFWATWILTGMIDWTNPTYALIAAPLMISVEYRARPASKSAPNPG